MANPSALFESHNLIVIVVKLEELDDDALDGRLVFVRPTERDTPVTLVDFRVVAVWGITNQATGHWRKSWRAPQVGGGEYLPVPLPILHHFLRLLLRPQEVRCSTHCSKFRPFTTTSV